MRLELTNGTIFVIASKRNLRTLLDKLENGIDGHESACMIEGKDVIVDGKATLTPFYLKVESDETHYGSREERYGDTRPGVMHAETESRIQV